MFIFFGIAIGISIIALLTFFFGFAMVRCGGYDPLSYLFLGILGGMATFLCIGIVIT